MPDFRSVRKNYLCHTNVMLNRILYSVTLKFKNKFKDILEKILNPESSWSRLSSTVTFYESRLKESEKNLNRVD